MQVPLKKSPIWRENPDRAMLRGSRDYESDKQQITEAWPYASAWLAIAQGQEILTVNYYDNYASIPGVPAAYSAPAGASTTTPNWRENPDRAKAKGFS